MKKDFLLEIGCENLPSGYIDGALRQLEDLFSRHLSSLKIEYGSLYVTGTPNRLVVFLKDLPAKQEASVTNVTGPPVSVAIAGDGSYTRAAEGFAKKHGVPVEKLVRIETEKGEYISVSLSEKGRSVADLFKVTLPVWIRSLRFPKVMKWDSTDLRFARPIRWIVAFLGDRPLKFDVGSIQSSSATRLSPFFEVTTHIEGPDHYFGVMKKARVILDRDAREKKIRIEAEKAAETSGGMLVDDAELCSMVANLVEVPVAMAGSFDRRFLQLPREVVVTALKSHQRYFSIQGRDGRLRPNFIAFADGARRNKAEILRGYERVLQARLEDAGFYYREDTSVSLEEMSGRLGVIVWLEGLGTLAEKSDRLAALASMVCEAWRPGDSELTGRAERASKLAKADLASEMVKDGKEFTLLQGYIGREYALVSGEDKEVAEAVFEHYLPRFAGDSVPATETGAAVALADRLDTIAGCFIQGFEPTGSQDPYALRRHAVGILRITTERDIPLNIPLSLGISLEKFGEAVVASSGRKTGDLIAGMTDLFSQRLNTMLKGEGFDYDLVSAVLTSPWEYPSTVRSTVRRLQEMRDSGTLQDFVLAMKRIVNILPKEHRRPVILDEGLQALDELSGLVDRPFDESLLKEKMEKVLLQETEEAARKLLALESGDLGGSLESLAGLVPTINSYFDEVLVNSEDKGLKKNRIAFLLVLSRFSGRFCNFSEIMVDQGQ